MEFKACGVPCIVRAVVLVVAFEDADGVDGVAVYVGEFAVDGDAAIGAVSVVYRSA